MDRKRRDQSRADAAARHRDAEDGRKAHDQSGAPYGTEEHLNEELAKRETIEPPEGKTPR